jgi:hypothetical protein
MNAKAFFEHLDLLLLAVKMQISLNHLVSALSSSVSGDGLTHDTMAACYRLITPKVFKLLLTLLIFFSNDNDRLLAGLHILQPSPTMQASPSTSSEPAAIVFVNMRITSSVLHALTVSLQKVWSKLYTTVFPINSQRLSSTYSDRKKSSMCKLVELAALSPPPVLHEYCTCLRLEGFYARNWRLRSHE